MCENSFFLLLVTYTLICYMPLVSLAAQNLIDMVIFQPQFCTNVLYNHAFSLKKISKAARCIIYSKLNVKAVHL